ncbi:MAG: DNA-3-methyladenine glycosylase family protein [Acidimicrobiales bacterium]
MAGLIDRFGIATLVRPRVPDAKALVDSPDRGSHGREPEDGVFFEALVTSIVHQQLAGAAAQAIHARLALALEGAIRPESVLAAGFDVLRGVGLSGTKATTMSDLAQAVVGGELDLGALGSVSEEEVIARLCRLRGIGPWTAQMFCLFTLGHLDVWPTTDLGVRKGFALAHNTVEIPSALELIELGEPYRPYRSVAAWYLWRATDG